MANEQNKSNELTVDELLDIGCRMSQELQEFIDAGEKGGSDMTAPRALLEEFNELFKRSPLYWQKAVVNEDIDMAWADKL